MADSPVFELTLVVDLALTAVAVVAGAISDRPTAPTAMRLAPPAGWSRLVPVDPAATAFSRAVPWP
jgi:hypothetical protein